MNTYDFTEDELRRWLLLRATEWCYFPGFISQPVVPISLIFFPLVTVLLSIFLINLLWVYVRYSYVNINLARFAVFFVGYLKWPATIGSFIYLLINKQYLPAVVALLWPAIVLIKIFFGYPGKIGVIELEFAKKIGYVNKNASL